MKTVMVEGFEVKEQLDGRMLASGPTVVEVDTSGGGQHLELAGGYREVSEAKSAYDWW